MVNYVGNDIYYREYLRMKADRFFYKIAVWNQNNRRSSYGFSKELPGYKAA